MELSIAMQSNLSGHSMIAGAMDTGPVLPLTNPRIGLVGPSTARRNTGAFESGASRAVSEMTSGQLSWLHWLFPNFQFVNIRDTLDPNSRGFSGDNFGVDSMEIADQIAFVDEVIAHPEIYDVLLWITGRGATDFTNATTVPGYCDPIKAKILQAKAVGIYVIWENLWPRDSTLGSPWDIGSACRQTLIDVNEEMRTWCALHNIGYIDARKTMVGNTDLNPADNPLANFITVDKIHYAAAGALAVAYNEYLPKFEIWFTELTKWLASDPDNIAPAMTGDGGTLLNTATSSPASPVQVPANWSAGRAAAGQARSCTISTVDDAEGHWTRFAIGSTGSPTANGEGITMRPTTNPIVSFWDTTKWYEARIDVVAEDTWIGWTAWALLLQDGATPQQGHRGGVAGSGDGGEIPVSGFSAAGQYRIRQNTDDHFTIIAGPFKPSHTSCEVRFNGNYLNATGASAIKVGNLVIKEVPAPEFVP